MSFLPEPLYNPRYPSPHTLTMRALEALLSGKHLSHPQFEALTGSWRLAGYVHSLKKLGWPIETEYQAMASVQEGDRIRSIVVYYLPEDLLDMVRGIQK